MKNKKSIPDRWLSYRKLGEPISGTRFFAFKVPLGERFFVRLRIDERFSPGQLFQARPDLGLVIDLTNTDRYYSSKWFVRNGISYRKIACPGKVIPAEKLVRKFCDIVHDFLRHTATKDSLIGVHCTHGINRTGYMICSYMIQQMQMDPRDAIAAFEVARGHTIERKEYIDALMNLRLDGSVSHRQSMQDGECTDECGPSSSTGPIGFGQGHRNSFQWKSRPEQPDSGMVHVRSNSPLPVGPSTSIGSAAWGSVSGAEVNIWSTASGSADSTWSSIPGPVAGPSSRNHNYTSAIYTSNPRLNRLGRHTKMHLPHTVSRPDTDLTSEPAHSSTTEYGSSQRERPIADGFSEPGRSQHIRGHPVRGRSPRTQGEPTSSHLAPPKRGLRLSPPLSSSSHPSSAGRRPWPLQGERRRKPACLVACPPAPHASDRDRGRERGGGGGWSGAKRREPYSENWRKHSTASQQEKPRVPPKLGQSEKSPP